jgi:hypothetical protein
MASVLLLGPVFTCILRNGSPGSSQEVPIEVIEDIEAAPAAPEEDANLNESLA